MSGIEKLRAIHGTSSCDQIRPGRPDFLRICLLIPLSLASSTPQGSPTLRLPHHGLPFIC
eukprot:COSAG01_NODE_1910_length_8928_cov_33.079964_9_plen_60_part_00